MIRTPFPARKGSNTQSMGTLLLSVASPIWKVSMVVGIAGILKSRHLLERFPPLCKSMSHGLGYTDNAYCCFFHVSVVLIHLSAW